MLTKEIKKYCFSSICHNFRIGRFVVTLASKLKKGTSRQISLQKLAHAISRDCLSFQ